MLVEHPGPGHRAVHPAHDARLFAAALVLALVAFLVGAGVAIAPGITG